MKRHDGEGIGWGYALGPARLWDPTADDALATLHEGDGRVLVVAEWISPMVVGQISPTRVVGFALEGDEVDWQVRLAYTVLKKAAVCDLDDITDEVEPGTRVILDSLDGECIVDPTEETIREYDARRKETRLPPREKAIAEILEDAGMDPDLATEDGAKRSAEEARKGKRGGRSRGG